MSQCLRESVRRVSGWVIACLVAVLATCWGAPSSFASSSPSIEQLEQAVAALEARVNALAPLQQRVKILEAKLKQYETASAVVQPEAPASTGLILASLTGAGPASDPMRLAAPAQDAASDPQSGWAGLYWGTSVGFGATGSSSRYWNNHRSQDIYGSSNTYSSQSEDYSYSDASAGHSIRESIEHISGGSEGTEWNSGALADLYLGASTHITPRIIAGVQVEGGLSQMLFQSTIPRESLASRSTERTRSTSKSGDGDTSRSRSKGSSSEVQSYIYDEQNKLELDWMFSVIGRAGYLAAPNTLLYGLAGWTYGHFTADDLPFNVGYGQISDFGSHGITVGGGLEQKLSSKWSLRAEYRYTNFGKENFSKKAHLTNSISSKSSSRSADSSTCCDGYTSEGSSQDSGTSSSTYRETYRSNGYFDNDMHVGRIGVTRYFTLGD